MQSSAFVFTGIIIKEDDSYAAICPELDVATDGDSAEEASANLLEAVNLYIETAIDANLPYLRPIPADEDPRKTNPEAVVKIFNLKVDIEVKAHA